MPLRSITALPVFNEVSSLDIVLDEVLKYSDTVLVVDDGSTDGTTQRLKARNDSQLHVIHHPQNTGYGAALQTAFQFAQENEFQTVVTVDCDGQHEPCLIPDFVKASEDADIISGSRYLGDSKSGISAPEDRRRINMTVTRELNSLLCLELTDAFCGFKAYRTSALKQLQLTQNGYAMPLELWAQAAMLGLRIEEKEVPLIYLDANRSFGEALDDAELRLAHYRRVIDCSVQRARLLFRDSPSLCGEGVG